MRWEWLGRCLCILILANVLGIFLLLGLFRLPGRLFRQRRLRIAKVGHRDTLQPLLRRRKLFIREFELANEVAYPLGSTKFRQQMTA